MILQGKVPKKDFVFPPTTEVSQMVLTRANQSDIEGLVELLTCLFEQEAEFQPNPDLQRKALGKIIDNSETGVILVAKVDNKILGMVNLLFTESTALGSRVAILEDMIVAAASRGKGIGSLLIDYAIQEATHLGCKRITLLTDSENIQAQDFYQKKGFTKSTMTPLRLLID
jgi:GNAT superfamily N-acetyltransferase